jgi:hypothetical protein
MFVVYYIPATVLSAPLHNTEYTTVSPTGRVVPVPAGARHRAPPWNYNPLYFGAIHYFGATHQLQGKRPHLVAYNH